MHRHGYKGRKFGRERDQREALIKSLSEALIINGAIETTLPKAKELVPYMEKLITKAKKGDLHNRRLIMAKLQTISSAHKLVDEIAPRLGGRTSGHLRIERTIFRRGDNAEMARVSFVDDLKAAPKPASKTSAASADKPTTTPAAARATKRSGAAAKPAAKKPAPKRAAVKKPAAKKEATK
jgi:large subunit ribosomal protein L17